MFHRSQIPSAYNSLHFVRLKFVLRFMAVVAVSVIQGITVPELFGSDSPPSDPPVRALLITGGCCHDYDRQKLILPRGISARANVEWTVVHQGGTTTDTAIPFYDQADWAKGFDIVVHNECFADVKDPDFVDRVLAPHRQGVPAVLIHCAMHCYRVGDDRWFEFAGVQSPGHGPHYAYSARNLNPEHPVMTGFGTEFVTPKGELYDTVRIFETARPLAAAERQSDGKPQVCIWTNEYRGTRVFGTTIGHYNETMAEPAYLDFLTRGLLWAVGKDPVKDFRPASDATTAEIRKLVMAPIADTAVSGDRCCTDGNLAHQKPVTFSSQQSGNDGRFLVDGRLKTRWCADGAQTNEWVMVDLSEPQSFKSLRIHWEMQNAVAYRYKVESSPDQREWHLLVDESGNRTPNGIATHTFNDTTARYLRITYLGSNTGHWGSIRELEVARDQLPEFDPATANSVSVDEVQSPSGFDTRIFAAPPQVNYPVCITTSINGEVFVGIDEQGSLGKEADRGRVVRCVDTDGDGRADRFNDFARMDHPRGLIYDNGQLWVLHPPFLSVFRDTNGDGTSDEQEVLVEGISTDEVNKRGADHTTNGIRMGIDGWIYIAVGDFGFTKAVGKDGRTLSRRGGGVVRVRPDGTDLEIFSWGQRNIVDVAIDPHMNLFTRDNTNDGGGWDIRLSHVMQTANYGYPSLYINFADEIMPPLADYGGGSGCGALYLYDARWPAGYNDLLLTCDWGRSEVFSHRLPPNEATFDPEQQTFLRIPRPTDADIDASGRLFVTSWKDGNFSYDGPNVGFVALITPSGFIPRPAPRLSEQSPDALIKLLDGPSASLQLAAQRELLRRVAGLNTSSAVEVESLIEQLSNAAMHSDTSAAGRSAMVYTLAQISSPTAITTLRRLASSEATAEAAIRCLADNQEQISEQVLATINDGLKNPAPRVRAAAIVAAGRSASTIADNQTLFAAVAEELLTLSVVARPEPLPSGDLWRLPDPARVLPHLARRALADLHAVEPCLKALGSPQQSGALAALSLMHSPAAVDGLFRVLGTTRDDQLRKEIWTTLIRLYHTEAEFKSGWWGTRPDTTGPYYDRAEWSESVRIRDALTTALAEGDSELSQHLQQQLKRHQVALTSTDVAAMSTSAEPEKPITIAKSDPNNPDQIGNLAFEHVLSRALQSPGDPEQGKLLFKQQSCINCHTYANGMLPKGPHLVDIGKRYKRSELIESIVKPGAKIAQGFDTWTFALTEGQVHSGFVVLESAETVIIRENTGVSRELLQDEIEERVKQEASMMPNGIVDALTPEQLSDLLAWLESLH